mgnify:CR=1 FL=1
MCIISKLRKSPRKLFYVIIRFCVGRIADPMVLSSRTRVGIVPPSDRLRHGPPRAYRMHTSLSDTVIPGVRRARKPKVFGREPCGPGSRNTDGAKLMQASVHGFRTPRFANQIKDLGQTGFRNDALCESGRARPGHPRLCVARPRQVVDAPPSRGMTSPPAATGLGRYFKSQREVSYPRGFAMKSEMR